MKWKDLRVPRGRYISPIYSISNKLDKYIVTIEETIHNPYNHTIEYYFQVSYNRTTWSEWERIYPTSTDFLHDYELDGLYIRFSIIMSGQAHNQRLYLRILTFRFKPYAHIENEGSLPILPKIWIRKKNGKGDIKMINHSTNQVMEFKNLNNGEEVYVDCENEEIVSSSQSLGVYRYDDHNAEFLELIKGDNYITFEGDFDWDARYKAKLLQE